MEITADILSTISGKRMEITVDFLSTRNVTIHRIPKTKNWQGENDMIDIAFDDVKSGSLPLKIQFQEYDCEKLYLHIVRQF